MLKLKYKLTILNSQTKRGGGVCIYARNDLKSKVLKDLSYISDLGLHQLWVQIQLNKNKSIIVCITYKPPNCPVACINDELKPIFIKSIHDAVTDCYNACVTETVIYT